MKRILMILFAALLPALCLSATAERALTILFTSDIHSYFAVTDGTVEGVSRQHGGAGRLKALLDENRTENSVLLDAGDFSMGTLLHTGFTEHAYELRLMGMLGYDATTFGNHEFDFDGTGAAAMLNSAMASGDPLPTLLIPANLDLSGTLTEEQALLKETLEACGSSRWIVKDAGGIRVAVFGLLGKEAISNAPTSGMLWTDPIKAAKEIVKEIGNSADVIVCVSHSGTDADGISGEDVDLLKQVPELAAVVSGHTHIALHDVSVPRSGSALGASGCYMSYLGRMDLIVNDDGTVECTDYRLIPIDEDAPEDEAMTAVVDGFMEEVSREYLGETEVSADTVIARTTFELGCGESGLDVRGELPLGTLIADSYLYAARENGCTDIDVALVAQGTIRGALSEGDITVADAFRVCSLGKGADGSAGHPLVKAYVTGSQIRFIAELDSLVSASMSSLRMNYGGMRITVDEGRVPFDRVTSMVLIREDGTEELMDPKKSYCVAANMYAVNMIGSIRSMTRGLVDLSPKDEDGTIIPADDYYSYILTRTDGTELKEWTALRDYLMSFESADGVPEIPERYAAEQGRKVLIRTVGPAILLHPGVSTLIVIGLCLLPFVIAGLIVSVRRRKRRAAKR